MTDSVESPVKQGESGDGENLRSSIQTVSDGAVLYVVNAGLRNVTGFLLNVVLTNTLGAVLYGVFTYGRQILTSLLLFVNVGSDVSTTRYVSGNQNDPERRDAVLGFGVGLTVLASLPLSLVLFVSAPAINASTLGEPALPTVLRLFAIALPFQALSRIVTSAFRGLEQPGDLAAVTAFGHLLRLALIGGAVLLGYSLLGATVAYVLAVATVLVVGAVALFVRTDLRPARPLGRGQVRKLLNYSLPLTVSRGGNLLYNRVDLFMVGIFLGASEVAIYNVALLVATIISLPLAGFNQFFPSVSSRLYANDEHETLETVYRAVTRWTITMSLLVALPALLYRAELLSVFGEQFTDGTLVLALFVTGQFVNALSGPSNDVLTMTDNQYVVLANNWVFGLLNVGLNYAFITEFGLIGAAVATASVLGLLNVARVCEVWYIEGYLAYSRQLWKPLFAAGCATAALLAADRLLSGYALLLAGSTFGVGVFLAVLYSFGLEEEERLLIEAYREE